MWLTYIIVWKQRKATLRKLLLLTQIQSPVPELDYSSYFNNNVEPSLAIQTSVCLSPNVELLSRVGSFVCPLHIQHHVIIHYASKHSVIYDINVLVQSPPWKCCKIFFIQCMFVFPDRLTQCKRLFVFELVKAGELINRETHISCVLEVLRYVRFFDRNVLGQGLIRISE